MMMMITTTCAMGTLTLVVTLLGQNPRCQIYILVCYYHTWHHDGLAMPSSASGTVRLGATIKGGDGPARGH